MDASAEKEKILVIDDEVEFCLAFKEFLDFEGYNVQTWSNPIEALKVLDRFYPDCVVLDLRMPHMNGVEVLKIIKSRQPDTPVIISSAHDHVNLVEECMLLGATGYVTKPVDLDNLLKEIRFAINQKQEISKKKAAEQQTSQKQAAFFQREILHKIESTLHFLELTEPELISHSRNVAWLCKKLSEKLIPAEVDLCEFCGWFHDLGKLRIPREFRLSPNNDLDPRKQKVFRNFPVHGQDLVEEVFNFQQAATIIRHQNENFDGSGYPDGLKEDSIPLESRILAVSNAFVEEHEAMGQTHFSLAMENGKSLVLKFMTKDTDRYDPNVVSTLMTFIQEHKYSSLREKEVPPGQLRPGMILSRNLMTETGIFLFPANTKLTERRIGIIKDFSLIDTLPRHINTYFTK